MDCKLTSPPRPGGTRCQKDASSGRRRARRRGLRRLRFGRILAAGLCFWAYAIAPAESVELVMFEAPLCEWCALWDDEVGVVYHKTSEGRLAPLRRVALHEPRPADLAQIAGVRYSPTFVLLDQGREVGRIVGYPGEDHFWGLLQGLLEDLPQVSKQPSIGDMRP